MTALNLADMSSRIMPVARKNWVKKEDFHPGGHKGKLHRELGIAEDKKIPAARLAAAAHSGDPEIKRDAIRAQTMKKWNHGGASRRSVLYDHKRSQNRG